MSFGFQLWLRPQRLESGDKSYLEKGLSRIETEKQVKRSIIIQIAGYGAATHKA